MSLVNAYRLRRVLQHGRLHSAIGYLRPLDKLAGSEDAIFADRDRKLEAARAQRQLRRAQARNIA